MTIRMKAKFYFCLSKIAKDPHLYNPLATAEWGTHLYEERVKLTELYKKAQKLAGYKDINKQDCEQAGRAYKTAKAAFLAQLDKEKNKKTAPTILSMELKHGDLVVMHGGSLQERYEVYPFLPPPPAL